MFNTLIRTPLLIFGALLIVVTGALPLGAPQTNPHFPINERNLSAPILNQPIHECALIRRTSVSPMRATSFPTSTPFANKRCARGQNSVVADAFPTRLSTPVPVPSIYACGRMVPVDNLTPSTRVQVSDIDRQAPLNPLIGTGENVGTWTPVLTGSLEVSHHVTAVQIACADLQAKTTTSPTSHPPLPVTASPAPVFKPTVAVERVCTVSEACFGANGNREEELS